MTKDFIAPQASSPSVVDSDATRILSPQAAAVILSDDATVIVGSEEAAKIQQAHAQAMGFPKTQSLESRPSVSSTAVPTTTTSSATVSPVHANGLLTKGMRVAEFEILRLIGQGGFGIVYEAWDHALERVVAIKEYMPSSLATRQSDGNIAPLSERHQETFDLGMRSFINEARLLAQFDHPALLKVYRFWQERGTTYMVMPLYQGKTLKEALGERKGQVDEAWLLQIIDGVTQALAVMHASDCYHRDIAPDNIMLLEHSGQPVVLDFGAARRVIKDVTQAITVILKPGYAPVEQYSESPDMRQGPWTDVYALCAVMYAAMTDRAPPPAVARMIHDRCVPLSADAALLERFNPRVLQAVDRGLAVMPNQRPQSMMALREELGLSAVTSASDGYTQISIPAQSSASRMVHPIVTKKPPIKWVVGVPLLILSITSIALWWFFDGQKLLSQYDAKPAIASTAVPPQSPPASAAPALPTPPKSALDSIKSLAIGGDASWQIVAKPGKEEVLIGKDRLSFQIRSPKAGFVYVYLLSSTGDLYLLFPNAIDKRNQISADTDVQLPRTSWAMDAGGPAGVNEFTVLVADHEMDMGNTGFRFDGVFGKFPGDLLAGMESARGSGKSPLLGAPICSVGAACSVTYGTARFKITEK